MKKKLKTHTTKQKETITTEKGTTRLQKLASCFQSFAVTCAPNEWGKNKNNLKSTAQNKRKSHMYLNIATR